jgi:hypothetical protein
MNETPYEIVNRKNIEAIKEVIKAEREERKKASQRAQDAINSVTMLREEITQLKTLVAELLNRI